MLFNSIDFALFFPVVFLLYWLAVRPRLRLQNLFLLAASYVFYGWWDWRFLSLILISSLVDFTAGGRIHGAGDRRTQKAWLILSVGVNLGLLGFFKYFNFFAESFQGMLAAAGWRADPVFLEVILPVGISFYTFQTMTYTIDIYRGRLKPTDDPVAFFAFVAFFPQLVAGPIERAGSLLPQFENPRRWDWAAFGDGLRQTLWGLFKKAVIADNLALQVDRVFSGYQALDGASLALGVVFFAIQIYCDFSGYSDMALGTARMLGFELRLNFAYPYFSRNVAEFWRRWHISLSSWFRDYLYIPLGGNRRGKRRTIINVLITFTLCGLWHGAAWTFVVWGLLFGLYYIPLVLSGRQKPSTPRAGFGRALPSPAEVPQITGTFALTCLAWVFFRAESLGQALGYIGRALSAPYLGLDYGAFGLGLGLIAFLMVVEWIQRDKAYALALPIRMPLALRWAGYWLMIVVILELGARENAPFIYFQF
jgi:D-alanyl-lipoteichoic acid acyltransferase DltB (MBOAT superfamily)